MPSRSTTTLPLRAMRPPGPGFPDPVVTRGLPAIAPKGLPYKESICAWVGSPTSPFIRKVHFNPAGCWHEGWGFANTTTSVPDRNCTPHEAELGAVATVTVSPS